MSRPMPSDLDIARSVTPRPIDDIAAELGTCDPTRSSATVPTKAKVTLEGLERVERENPRGKYVVVTAITPTPAGRRQDDHHRRARAGAQPDRSQGRGGHPPALAGPGLRHQGRRGRRRLLPGHPDGGLQPPPHRRRPRHRCRAQPRERLPRQPASTTATRSTSTPTRSAGRASSTSATAPCARSSSASAARPTACPRESEFVITVASRGHGHPGPRDRPLRPARAPRPHRHGHRPLGGGGHRRGPRRGRRHDRAAARRHQAQPAADARGRPGLRPLRARSPTSPTATARSSPTGVALATSRHRRHRGRLRRRHGRREVLRHQVPRVGPGARLRPSWWPPSARSRCTAAWARSWPASRSTRRCSRRTSRPCASVRENLAAHIEIVRPVRRARWSWPSTPSPATPTSEFEAIREVALAAGARDAVVTTHWADGGAGAEALAAAVWEAADEEPADFQLLYPTRCRWPRRSRPSRPRSTAPTAWTSRRPPAKALAEYEPLGFGHLPVCMAKTHLSISHDPSAAGPARPASACPIREVKLAAGAGFIYPLAGDMRTMPGLPSQPGRRERRHRRERQAGRPVLEAHEAADHDKGVR